MREGAATVVAAADQSVRSAVKEVSAHREMAGLIVSAGEPREMNP